jgi:hypothetical protein
MAYCPHCNVRYDESNETQPCCYSCGHPISCGCGGGHSHSPPSPSVPPSVIDDVTGDDQTSDDETDSGDDSEEETFSPDDNLPF